MQQGQKVNEYKAFTLDHRVALPHGIKESPKGISGLVGVNYILSIPKRPPCFLSKRGLDLGMD